MRIRKAIVVILLSILTITLFLPVQTSAAGSVDFQQTTCLTIACQEHEISLVGTTFDIYLIAKVDENGELTATDAFSQFHVNIRGENDDAWRKLTSTLKGYILRDGITPADSGITDERGLLTFPKKANSLEHGLYLIMGHRHEQDGYIYETEPFMILLPSLDEQNNEWCYDVTVNPKYESKPELEESTITRKVLKVWEDDGHENERPQEVVIQLLQDNKIYDTVTLNDNNNWRYTWTELDDDYSWNVVEKELVDYTVEVTQEGITYVVTNIYNADNSPSDEPNTPTDPKLPQTGQFWWPVPCLSAAGLLLVVIGLLRRRGIGYEK